LRQLLERDAVEEARTLVHELENRWPESERVRHLASVLAPPRSSAGYGERRRSFRREQAWLREHAREHPGCWLSVFEDRLVGADPELKTVLEETRRSIGSERALIHFQPKSGGAD